MFGHKTVRQDKPTDRPAVQRPTLNTAVLPAREPDRSCPARRMGACAMEQPYGINAQNGVSFYEPIAKYSYKNNHKTTKPPCRRASPHHQTNWIEHRPQPVLLLAALTPPAARRAEAEPLALVSGSSFSLSARLVFWAATGTCSEAIREGKRKEKKPISSPPPRPFTMRFAMRCVGGPRWDREEGGYLISSDLHMLAAPPPFSSPHFFLFIL